MSIENLIEKFDGLATVTVGVLVTKMLIEYFKKKLNHEADKEDNINAILTKQLETLVENSVNYKNDINDLKRLTAIEDLIKILRSEQRALKEKLETIITNYVQNKNSNLTHEEISNDTKKNIKELLTFTSIDLSTNIYNVLNGLNIYETR